MKRLIASGLSALLLGAVSTGVVSAQTTTGNPGMTGTPGGTGNWIDYPYGTRIYSNGVIHAPTGESVTPSVTVPGGDGSTTFYYPNGTHITVNEGRINPTGTLLRSGSQNGGLSNDTMTRPNRTFSTP
jgi:hypothetical protein